MHDAAAWTARLCELAEPTRVPGATLGIWARGQEILAAYGVLGTATQVPVTTDSLFQAELADRTPHIYLGNRVTPPAG